MNLQGRLRCETLRTNVALEGLVPCEPIPTLQTRKINETHIKNVRATDMTKSASPGEHFREI